MSYLDAMRYFRKAWDVAGYSYAADTYCPACILTAVTGEHTVSTDVEGQLDGIAEARGIDRHDERSFDSGDFPKVIFVSDVEDDRCSVCGEAL